MNLPLPAGAFFVALLVTTLPAVAQKLPTQSTAEEAPAALQDMLLDGPRFDLNFDSLPLSEVMTGMQHFVAQRTGTNLNIVIPGALRELADNEIVSLRLEQVTVREFFELLAAASQRPVPGPTGDVDPRTGAPIAPAGPKMVGYRFEPLRTGNNPNVAWILRSDLPLAGPAESGSLISESPSAITEYFALSRYLTKYRVEDIITAVRAGWEMRGLPQQPRLKFHEETKLLIAVGQPDDVRSVHQVLEQLEFSLGEAKGSERLAPSPGGSPENRSDLPRR
jgi:hypothetical protein